jgi:hypothetical protein
VVDQEALNTGVGWEWSTMISLRREMKKTEKEEDDGEDRRVGLMCKSISSNSL